MMESLEMGPSEGNLASLVDFLSLLILLFHWLFAEVVGTGILFIYPVGLRVNGNCSRETRVAVETNAPEFVFLHHQCLEITDMSLYVLSNKEKLDEPY